MKLVFLFGLPGVGKLTLARQLAKFTGFKVFHNHLAVDLAGSMFEFGSRPFVELREKVWLAALAQALASDLPGLIFTFAYDRTVTGNFITQVRERVTANSGTVQFVEMKCSMDELEKRITNPARRRFSKLNSVEQFRALKEAGAFVDPGIPLDRIVLETTELSPAEAATQLVSRLGLKPLSR